MKLNIAFATSSDFTLAITQNILENKGQNLREIAQKQAQKMGLNFLEINNLEDFEIDLKTIITQPVKTRKGTNLIQILLSKTI